MRMLRAKSTLACDSCFSFRLLVCFGFRAQDIGFKLLGLGLRPKTAQVCFGVWNSEGSSGFGH